MWRRDTKRSCSLLFVSSRVVLFHPHLHTVSLSLSSPASQESQPNPITPAISIAISTLPSLPLLDISSSPTPYVHQLPPSSFILYHTYILRTSHNSAPAPAPAHHIRYLVLSHQFCLAASQIHIHIHISRISHILTSTTDSKSKIQFHVIKKQTNKQKLPLHPHPSILTAIACTYIYLPQFLLIR